MRTKLITTVGLGAAAAFAVSGLFAETDWTKVPGKTITLFYPGPHHIEWITKGNEHGGARALKEGETCVGCHGDGTADLGKEEITEEITRNPSIRGKAGFIPVNVQASHDGTNLYLRFTWKQPAARPAKAKGPENEVRLALMLEANNVPRANQSGCWETCHNDARTMPGIKDDKKTKYIKGGNADTMFYDLLQWRSATNKGTDGYVADKRVMEGGQGLVEAKGERQGDEWVVTFVRKLAGGGKGDIKMESGKTYNIGFAIHDDGAVGRHHQVSLGYQLGIDTPADITAAKQ